MKKLTLFLFCFSVYVFSATLYVDINGSQTYTNIQEAINAAPTGDWTEIYIYPGVYHENLLINTNQHLLLSSTNELSSATRDATIIDGGGIDSVIKIYGETGWQNGTTCAVAGVTITNGIADAGGGINGGVHWSSAINYVNIRRCIITDCHAASNHYSQGGGAVFGTKGNVVSNIFRGNSSAYHGGALMTCDKNVSYNLIINNKAARYGGGAHDIDGDFSHNIVAGNSGSSGGGAAYLYGNCAYNIISGNYTRSYSGDGGGLLNASRSASLYNNIICNNVAARNGGGIDCGSLYNYSDFLNNLICNNIASNSGGGIANVSLSFFLNNTIAGNWARYNGGGVYSADNSVFINTIIYSNISQNSSASNIFVNGKSQFYYSCIDENIDVHSSCINAEPKFVNCPSDFHLLPGSLCLDAGISNMHYSMLPWSDLDGKLREQNGIDMGCYEQGTALDTDGDLLEDSSEPALLADPKKWDTNGDGYSDGSHISHGQSVTGSFTNVTFQVSAGESVQAKLAQSVPGDTVLVGPGTFNELLIPYYGIYFRGTTNQNGELITTLNGGADKPVMIYSHRAVATLWGADNILSDLVISNGNSYVGGGINYNIYDYSFEVNNCKFVNNKAKYGGAIGRPDASYSGFNTIADCKFIGNTATEDGGAIFNIEPSSDFVHSLFVNNTASNGAAIASAYGLIYRCVISNNTAYNMGGAVYDHSVSVVNSLIVSNTAAYGGALAEFGYVSYAIQNNTICKNSASQSGGAIYETAYDYKFFNNIVWGNSAPANPQIDASVSTNYAYNAIQDWAWLQKNNSSNYPDFTDWNGDNFHLLTNSYCIDSGTNYPPYDIFDWRDLDGNYRVINVYVDRGCYEHYNAADDINYNDETNKIIVVIKTPGGKQIIKKVVITKYPCGKRVKKGLISYPTPGGMDYPVKRVVTTGDNSTLWTYDAGWGYFFNYLQDAAGAWVDLYDIFGKSYYHICDLFPRDGREGYYGAVYDDSYYNDRGLEYWANDGSCPFTTTIDPSANGYSYGLGLPGDRSVISGEDGSGAPASWSVQPDPANPFGGAVFTATLPGYYGGGNFTPGYVDLNGDSDYDNDAVWHIDDTTGNAELYDIDDNSVAFSTTTPLPGGGDYLIGSYPDGIAVAEKDTKNFYTYVYDPTTPGNGKWCTDTFEYVIEKLGYTTTKKIIPEPFAAILIYLLGALALIKIFKK